LSLRNVSTESHFIYKQREVLIDCSYRRPWTSTCNCTHRISTFVAMHISKVIDNCGYLKLFNYVCCSTTELHGTTVLGILHRSRMTDMFATGRRASCMRLRRVSNPTAENVSSY